MAVNTLTELTRNAKTQPKPFDETDWWQDLMDGIKGPRQGGARIIIDAENAATGVGKTGLAVYLARLLAKDFDYELQEEDLTLSGAHYLDRWREHPGEEQPSVVILDELGGAGAGLARRAMSTQNVELANAWQLMRKKRIVSIVTLPHWSRADKDLRQQANFRLWCKAEPIGHFRPYMVGAGFDDGGVETHGYYDIEQIQFPNMDAHDDRFFNNLADKKDELLDSEYFDADKLGEDGEEVMSPEEVRRQEQLKSALRLVQPWDEERGMSYTDAADKIDYEKSWVSNRMREWRNGEHRNLVDKPTT